MIRSTAKEISGKEARNMRLLLDTEGFERSSGSGRGTSWTRHVKGSRVVFVEKVYGQDVWFTWEMER